MLVLILLGAWSLDRPCAALDPVVPSSATERADSSRHKPFQVGITASSILKLLEEGDPTHQYHVYGRYWTSRRRMVRTALRYRQVLGEDTEVDVGLRGGMAHVFRIDERWRFYGGGDLIAGYRRFANGNTSYRVGISPLFGASFFISRHVSLSVEPRLVAEYAQSQEDASPESRSDVISITIEGTGLLILSVHF